MLKRMLVAIDASPRSSVRLDVALALAQTHQGEVTALYSVLPALLSTPWVAAEGMAVAASLMADLDREQRQRAQAIVQRAGDSDRLRWLDGGDAPYATLLQQGFLHDLVVLGQTDATDPLTGALPQDLVTGCLIDGGRPTLLVPAMGRFHQFDGPIVLAWKPTREAARAVSAALPWLRRATQIHIASQPEPDVPAPPLTALEHWLQLQGVRAPVHHRTLPTGDAGAWLLHLAADVSASLLVMGCYGHSRTREWVMGGATRTVLRDMTLPVLMVH